VFGDHVLVLRAAVAAPAQGRGRVSREGVNHSDPRLGHRHSDPVMTLLFVFLLLPLALAIVLARGEPVRTISCLGAMGVGCVIACLSVASLLRHRARPT
jgi:hypothetical protein